MRSAGATDGSPRGTEARCVVTAGCASLLLALAAAALACGGDRGESDVAARVYLSLGDSVAAGSGASDADATSFAAVVAAQQGATLVNLAEPGSTTQAVIDEQLPEATRRLSAERVAFVTVSAGGNDLAALIPNASCTQEPLPDSCPLAATLDGVERRFTQIVAGLREADTDVPIVLLAYPNFFSGTGHVFDAPAARVLPRLNDVIRRVAGRYDAVAVADAEAAFDGRGGELTGVLDERFDPHPNDAGHAVIADAFGDALRELRED